MSKALFIEEFKKFVVKSFFFVCVGIIAIIFTPYWDNVKAVWNSPVYVGEKLDRIASTQNRIEDKVDENANSIESLLGNDRVIRQPSGSSYVREPVHVGEEISIFYLIQRTEYGKVCILKGAQPLFRDEVERTLLTGVLKDSLRQATVQIEDFLITIIPPEGLNIGRIEVHLVLEYNCDGRTVFDKTDILAYNLLEKI